MSLSDQKEIVKLEKKLIDLRSESYVSELRGLNSSELDSKLLELAKHKQEIITSMKNDDELNRIAEEAKELKKPYNESKKQNELISRFVGLLIKEKELE